MIDATIRSAKLFETHSYRERVLKLKLFEMKFGIINKLTCHILTYRQSTHKTGLNFAIVLTLMIA